MGGPMHKTPNSDLLVAEDPLLEIQIPWTDAGPAHDTGKDAARTRWQPRRTILVSLAISLALWAAIAALLF